MQVRGTRRATGGVAGNVFRENRQRVACARVGLKREE